MKALQKSTFLANNLMKKNDIYELFIEDMSAEGSGIGKIDNMAVFVPLTAVGDRIKVRILKVKSKYAYGKIEEMLESSPNRINPDCDSFSRCGGCVYRHISYKSESEIKYNRVYNAIKRIGKVDLKPNPIQTPSCVERYRNKAQYPINEDGDIGFFANHSHRIIPCGDCRLQPSEFYKAGQALKEFIKSNKISVYNELQKKGIIRHFYIRKAFKTGEIMAVLVINAKSFKWQNELVLALKNALGENLKSVYLNINTKDTNVILGDECRLLYGSEYITDILCGLQFRISPLSFYQVNRDMAERLYEKALEFANPKGKKILDLYCGAGTIGLSMAKCAKEIIGAEIVPEAIEDAKKNAKLNGIKNARFICGDASIVAVNLKKEGISPDVVILDPPRKGCDKGLIKTVSQDFAPERVVYVSCDPATLARDIEIFSQYGYTLLEYTPFDLFPRTSHVETVCLLLRENQ